MFNVSFGCRNGSVRIRYVILLKILADAPSEIVLLLAPITKANKSTCVQCSNKDIESMECAFIPFRTYVNKNRNRCVIYKTYIQKGIDDFPVLPIALQQKENSIIVIPKALDPNAWIVNCLLNYVRKCR